MNIASYQKFTLVDYPGKIATTVFTVGCNFRCPFCHNPELVVGSQMVVAESKMEKEFFDFLRERKGKLEAVCITGGEPTLQSDILEFMGKIKELGYLVKLDSNGTRPDILKKAMDEKIVDYVAMDIKNNLDGYEKTVATKVDLGRIKLSVELLKNGRVDYEFRTTVVPGLHSEKDFLKIAKWLKGAKKYCLQEYRDQKILDPKLKDKTKGKNIDLDKIKKQIASDFQKVEIRKYSE